MSWRWRSVPGALARAVRAQLGTSGDEHSRWVAQFARSVAEAQHSDAEYREVMDIRQERMRRHRERGNMAGVAAELWALARIEILLRHTEAARPWMDQGFAALEHATPPIVRLALDSTVRVAHVRLLDYRFDDAEVLCGQGAAAFASPQHVRERLVCVSEMALTQALGWRWASAMQSCELGDELVRRLVGGGNPYRGSEQLSSDVVGTDATFAGTRRALLSLGLARARACGGLGRSDAAESTLVETIAVLPNGLSAHESNRVGSTRGWLADREGRYTDAACVFRSTAAASATAGSVEIGRTATLALGAACLCAGAADEAVDIALQLLRDAPEDLDGASLCAAAEFARGRIGDAESWARREGPSRRHPLASAQTQRVLAEVELARGELDAALGHARSALATTTEFAGERDMASSEALITLARVESARAGACADTRFEEALALRMPADHPRRVAVSLAFAQAQASGGRGPT